MKKPNAKVAKDAQKTQKLPVIFFFAPFASSLRLLRSAVWMF
jgi:hypothetical protein